MENNQISPDVEAQAHTEQLPDDMKKTACIPNNGVDSTPYGEQSDTTISGWLAFFLYVTVGLGMVGSTIMSIIDLKSLGLESVFAILDIVVPLLSIVIGISTIVAFVKRRPNAVTLALTYMFFILFVNVIAFITSVMMGTMLTSPNSLSVIVGNIIWIVYLFNSKRVGRVIPKKSRVIGRYAKVLWTLCAVTVACYFSTTFFMPNNVSKLFFSDEAYIRMEIANQNNLSSSQLGGVVVDVEIQGKTIVMRYYEHVTVPFMRRLIPPTQEKIEEHKQSTIDGYMSDESLSEFVEILARNGYELCYKYNVNDGDICYEYVITNDELCTMAKGRY